MDVDRIVTPGEKVGEIAQFFAGYGVHKDINEGILISTLVGRLETRRRSSDAVKKGEPQTELRVVPMKPVAAMPFIGGVVIGRVIRVTPRAAHLEIVYVEGRGVTNESFKGMIRQQDVRQTEVDKVEIYKCFVPGDLVRADVISLGDRNSYYLSTATNELGVTYARSKAGLPMVAINWQEMQCPATKTKEFRKVAKQ